MKFKTPTSPNHYKHKQHESTTTKVMMRAGKVLLHNFFSSLITKDSILGQQLHQIESWFDGLDDQRQLYAILFMIGLIIALIILLIKLVRVLVHKIWYDDLSTVKDRNIPGKRDKLVTFNLVDGVSKSMKRLIQEQEKETDVGESTNQNKATDDDDEDLKKCLIVDYGSYGIKSGTAQRGKIEKAKLEPEHSVPCLIGKSKRAFKEMMQRDATFFGMKDDYIANEALLRRSILELHYPIREYLRSGKEMNLKTKQETNKLFSHSIYTVCGCPPNSSYNAAIVAGFDTDPSVREHMCHYFFEGEEDFENFDRILFTSQHALSMFSVGQLNGISVNIGATSSQIVPVYEGNALFSMQKTLPIGGFQLDSILGRLIAEYQNGINIGNNSSELDILRNVKEKWCYVSKVSPKTLPDEDVFCETYTLPDKNLLRLGKERYMCPEFIFDPDFDAKIFQIPVESPKSSRSGLCELTVECIEELRQLEHEDGVDLSQLRSNVVLHGGTTMLEGFTDRFCHDLNKLLYDMQQDVVVHARSNRCNSAFIGAQVLFHMPTSVFDSLSISRAEYAEEGPNIIRRKIIF